MMYGKKVVNKTIVENRNFACNALQLLMKSVTLDRKLRSGAEHRNFRQSSLTFIYFVCPTHLTFGPAWLILHYVAEEETQTSVS